MLKPKKEDERQTILVEQAWFWSKRWQRLECQAQADIDAGKVVTFDNVEDALVFLDQDQSQFF